MPAPALSAQQIVESLHRIAAYSRARLTNEDWDIIAETGRRLNQHEPLCYTRMAKVGWDLYEQE